MKPIIAFLLLLSSISTFASLEVIDREIEIEELEESQTQPGTLRSANIPHPYYQVQSNSENSVMNIESGIASFQLRLDMIKRAKKHIEVEYFIYNTDIAGKIFTRDLVEAAKRGVKVRILVDKSIAVFKLNNYYAKELAKYGIEVRYYNNVPLYHISTVQFRNHRKLLSIDDEEAISGGRNIGDDYFDLSDTFNFYDRDIYVKGPIVKTLRESFDKYFEHKIAERPKFPKLPNNNLLKRRDKYLKKTFLAQDFLVESEEEVATRKRVYELGNALMSLKKSYVCPIMTYSTDAPGATFTKRVKPGFSKNFRHLRKTLFDKVATIDKEILISSPYLINNRRTKKMMNSLLDKDVKVSVYTNSLASTDAIYVAANLYKDIRGWSNQGINIYLHDGKWLAENEDSFVALQEAKWGTHCKTQVYESKDYSEVMIGTYNIDNRSNFYNSEMGLFCRGNNDFTQEVKSNIFERASKGVHVNTDGTVTDKNGKNINILGSNQKGWFQMKLISLPSWLLRFLL